MHDYVPRSNEYIVLKRANIVSSEISPERYSSPHSINMDLMLNIKNAIYSVFEVIKFENIS